jgi:hypothetical protein
MAALAAVVSLLIAIQSYGADQYLKGRTFAENLCKITQENAIQQAEKDRYKDDIGAVPLSLDDAIALLSKRGELRH